MNILTTVIIKVGLQWAWTTVLTFRHSVKKCSLSISQLQERVLKLAVNQREIIIITKIWQAWLKRVPPRQLIRILRVIKRTCHIQDMMYRALPMWIHLAYPLNQRPKLPKRKISLSNLIWSMVKIKFKMRRRKVFLTKSTWNFTNTWRWSHIKNSNIIIISICSTNNIWRVRDIIKINRWW